MIELIEGRFQVRGLLGTGGSASVYLADDAVTGAKVAVKVLHPHLSTRPAARDFFLAEAERARALHHPHVTEVIDLGADLSREEPLVWIALEYVPGATLSEHVRASGPLSPSEATAILLPVLDALDEAHRVGLVHRDISPANIMAQRDADGRLDPSTVRLLDFGIAGHAGESATGPDHLLSAADEGFVGVLGNVSYMSPEQLRGQPVDQRGDVYQVGAVLYFLLVGRAPFRGDDARQTAKAHLDAPPPVPSFERPAIPRALDRVVVRAMLKEPDDRFSSVRAMRRELETAALASSGADIDILPAHPHDRTPDASDDRTGVTRVLGVTATPVRLAAQTPLDPFVAVHRRRLPRGSTAVAVVVAAVTVGIAASIATAPSVSLSDGASPLPPTTAPTPTATPTASPSPLARQMRVPDVTGQPWTAASEALSQAGFVVGAVTPADSAWPEGIVLATEPAVDAVVAEGSVVAFTVASGYNIVPDVAGMASQNAAAVVAAAGFATEVAPPSAAFTGGLRTDPAAGARLAVGSLVTILEPAKPAPTASPTPARSPSPTPTPTPTPKPTPAPTPSPTSSPTPSPTPTP